MPKSKASCKMLRRDAWELYVPVVRVPFGSRSVRISMHNARTTWSSDLSSEEHRHQLAAVARTRNWGLALILVGWLHLGAFSLCYYMTVGREYHESLGYLLVWIGEFCGMGAIFRLCGGPRLGCPPAALEVFVRRVWITYFVLAFNLGSLNTLRGHALFEFFPAIASLASFAFVMLSVIVDRRFFAAVLVMFASGLLMAAELRHAYLIFALAWWSVLNVLGAMILRPIPLFRSPRDLTLRHAGEPSRNGS